VELRGGGARDVLGADVAEERRVLFEEVLNTLYQDIGAFRAPPRSTRNWNATSSWVPTQAVAKQADGIEEAVDLQAFLPSNRY
jgi:hypothetical protein